MAKTAFLHPSKYETLKAGDVISLETYALVKTGKSTSLEVRDTRMGKLLSISTRWKEARDEKGKITSKELVGSSVSFEPITDSDCYLTLGTEKLRVDSVTICCGLFRVVQ